MFQNIQEEEINNTKEETNLRRNILTNIISKKYILLYILTFMVSSIGLGQAVSPFSLAIVVATAANEIPIFAILIIGLIGNVVGIGTNAILPYILTLLVFFLTFFITEPKYNDESRNELVKLGVRIFFASILIGMLKMAISGFLIYDMFSNIATSMLIYILYKVFTNSISVIINYTEKMAFTLEEVIGTSILIVIAASALGNFSILGYSIRNIIAIFVVLVLGWKNGILVGTTAGVTIGVTLGIIANTEPILIAVYSISGLIAGILNKFGKIGVIIGFAIGNIILTYLQNGGLENLIMFQEILIAGVGLLVVPKNIKLDIENIIENKRFLPSGSSGRLDRSTETIDKLNNVSKAVKELAENYVSVDQRVQNSKDIFITELLNYTDNLEDNILYDYISNVDSKIVDEIFNLLLKKQFVTEKDLKIIFAQNDIYLVEFEKNDTVKNDVEKMIKTINAAYHTAKTNVIWKQRLSEEKSNVGSQLKGVSKAILDIAEDIKTEIKSNELFVDEKEKILLLLKQKDMVVQDLSINKKDDDRFVIDIYIEKNDRTNVSDTIKGILEKNLNDKFKLIESHEIEKEKCERYIFASEDRYTVEIGKALAIKDNMSISGDSTIELKLKDGKYLLAISDGMGSGAEARKSSQIVIKLLKRLLDSGFKKETSLNLINTNLLNVGDDIFATLDIAIIDLYNGTIEYIKSGSAPTYIKNKKKIQIIKSISLPKGAIKETSQEVFDKDIESGDIIVMCSDGVIDSNVEYNNKELWLKYLLEDIENSDPQKIADIILEESIDNNYGKIKDDMSVLVCKLTKK